MDIQTIFLSQNEFVARATDSLRSCAKVFYRLATHKHFGILIFFSVIYLVFTFSIGLCGKLQQLVDIFSQNLLLDVMQLVLSDAGFAPWIIALFSSVIRGIGITVSFIPILGGLFLSLGFLEQSGYLTCAESVMNRFMRWFGLPGQSLVPMVIGFGCNVPAVLGAKILPNKRERIITILVTPFMSCSSRLAIYSIFVATFFPDNGQNIIFSLYLVGIAVAVFTGLAVKRFLPEKRCEESNQRSVNLKMPDVRELAVSTMYQVKKFVYKASFIILPCCVVLTLSFNMTPGQKHIPESLGRSLSPIFAPMGIDEDNWPAVIGLLSGVVAKELMIGSLNSFYAVENNTANSMEDIIDRAENNIKSALGISENDNDGPGNIMSSTMLAKFGSQASAYAYLLFVLLYFPCVSVLAAISKELDKFWASIAMIWTTGLAYTLSVAFYQTATFYAHPFTSTKWLLAIVLLYASSFIVLNFFPSYEKRICRPIPVKVV